MALRLKKSVQVHDAERHPAGGPLTTIEKGVYARDIPPAMLEQLHAGHFEEVDDGHDDGVTVEYRESTFFTGEDEPGDDA